MASSQSCCPFAEQGGAKKLWDKEPAVTYHHRPVALHHLQLADESSLQFERRLTHTDYLPGTLSDNNGSDTIEAIALCSFLMLTKSPFQVYEHPTDGNAGFRMYVYQGA